MSLSVLPASVDMEAYSTGILLKKIGVSPVLILLQKLLSQNIIFFTRSI